MNKLTEIKQRLDGLKNRGGLKGLGAYAARQYFHEFAEEDITYLISLLDEKDKALTFYADKETWNKPGVDQSNIAHKALSVSNNEGEAQMTPESVAKTLKEMSQLFNCSYEKAWKTCMHPAITEKFTLKEVLMHI